MMMTGTRCFSACSVWISSMPFMSGIIRSAMMTSGTSPAAMRSSMAAGFTNEHAS